MVLFKIILLLLLLALAFFAYRKTVPPLPSRTRAALVLLRAAAFVLVVLLLFDPRCTKRTIVSEKPVVAVLVDASASMSLPDKWEGGGGSSRFDVARRIHATLDSLLADRAVCRRYFFAGDLLDADPDSIGPVFQGTRIVEAVRKLHERTSGENLVAVVLVTDGVETERSLSEGDLPPVPVFTVGVGDTASPEDVLIEDVDYNPIVRAPAKTVLEATIANRGGMQKRARLTLSESGEELFAKDLLLPARGELRERMDLEVTRPGTRELELAVEVDGFDLEDSNNRRDIVVEVEKAELEVLVLDMYPSWEFRFLTGAFREEERISFDAVIPSRVGGMKREDLLPSLRRYDVLVVVSLDDLKKEEADALIRFVREDGKGLLVMPGRRSLYENERAWRLLQPILPVSGKPPFRFVFEYVVLLPGAAAAQSPLVSDLVPLFSRTDWQEMNPLLGFYADLDEAPGARVLLMTSGRNAPALVYGTAGRGRVAMLAAGPLWRWKFLARGNPAYETLLSRLIDVLATGEESERFSLAAKKNVFIAGEKVKIFAELFDRRMQPITGFPVSVEVARAGEEGRTVPISVLPMERGGVQSTRFEVVLPDLPPAEYVVTGKAALEDREIRSSPIEIRISAVSAEFQRVSQDRRRLTALARRTGGAYVEEDRVERLSSMLPLRVESREVETEIPLRTSVIFFSIVLLLLCIEWTVRKRSGMI